MAKRKSARSTDTSGGPGLRHAIPFATLSDELVPLFAPRLGVKATAAAVRGALADEAVIAERLRKVPAPALAVLERIVDAEGELRQDDVTSLAPRLGMDEVTVDTAVQKLFLECLVVVVMQSISFGPPERHVVILDVSAAAIAARVRGLTTPPAAPPELTPSAAQASTTRRDLVALLASAAHVPLRVTNYGDANRTSVKKLAKVLGASPETVGLRLDRATRAGVLGVRGKDLVPIASRLLDVARGEDVAEGADARRLKAWASAGWVARDTLVRALVAARHRDERRGRVYGGEPEGAGHRAFVVAEAIVDHAGLEAAEHGGHTYLRVPPVARGGGGDGHVTPSFEVMLGPGADPELVATVALATEPGRMDLVLTRKLTPASVAAALACGVGAEAILAALDRVGRHPVPDNVRFLVEEWSEAARTVRVQKVWALEASNAAAADEVARALGDDLVSRPTPTLILARGDVPDPSSRFAKTGVRVEGATIPITRGALPVDPPTKVDVVLAAPGPESMRDHFEREWKRGLETLEAIAPEVEAVFFAPEEVLTTMAKGAGAKDPALRQVLLTAARLWKGAVKEYQAWAVDLEPSAAAEALGVPMRAPLELLPWLTLQTAHRTAARRDARNLDDLFSASMRFAEQRRALSKDGETIRRLISRPHVLRQVEKLSQVSGELGSEAPPLASLEPQPPDEVRGVFLRAAARGTPVWLRVRSKTGGDRVVALVPERILDRGADVALLGVDPETEQNRSFPLANVLCVHPMRPPGSA